MPIQAGKAALLIKQSNQDRARHLQSPRPMRDKSTDLRQEMTSALVQLLTTGSGERVVSLSGDWTLAAMQGGLGASSRVLKKAAADPTLTWDLRSIGTLDSVGALLIWQAWNGDRRGISRFRPEHEALFARLASVPPVEPPRWRPDLLAPVVFIGRKEARFLNHALGFLALVGFLVIDALYLLTHPDQIPWKEISASVYKAGALSMPVTALVGFLIGVVISYLSANTLKAYGADLYIINLLGISIIRELGPLLVAILIAGRSGSAMTAQIGVMKVTEEIDAMATMGISPTLRLVLPKVLGLSLAMPLVSLWAIFAALLGGAVAAQVQLGINVLYFMQSLPNAVPAANIWIAAVKAVSFGYVIALVACHFGLRARPNTESVSSAITGSVVTAITMVIVLDAVFAIMFRHMGFK
jgi:phospholipid/cholesterol/gamma-HCH transport system permease protein